MKTLSTTLILLLNYTILTAQVKMTDGNGNTASADLRYNFWTSVTGEYYNGSDTEEALPIGDDGYHYRQTVLWNTSQSRWEFLSVSGTDLSSATVKSSNPIAVKGDGLDYWNSSAGTIYFWSNYYYPACEGWDENYKMSGRCLDGIKISTSGSLVAYDNSVLQVKRYRDPENYSALLNQMINSKIRYVGLVGTDSLQFIWSGSEWLFQKKSLSASARMAATNDDWETLATNSSDTPKAPDSAWNVTSGSGSLGLNGSVSPLPVVLSSFTAHPDEQNSVRLKWSTTMESNSSYFALERTRDMKNIQEITRKETGQDSDAEKRYEFIDRSPAPGMNYYRLRQVDFDGRSSLSRWVSALVENKNQPFGVFPNPVRSNQFEISVENSDEAVISMYDNLGKPCRIATEKKNPNTITVTSYQQLNPGTYVLYVKTITGSHTHKAIVIR